MKGRLVELEAPFKPLKLQLLFETEVEVQKFYAIFNHTGLINELDIRPVAKVVRDTLQKSELILGGTKYFPAITDGMSDPRD